MSTAEQSPHIAIVGSGLGGLTVAIALKRNYGYKNFTIYEKASEIGGTWRDNVYPGAASDVPIHLYTLSTDLDYRFNHSHGTSAEIKAYWHRLATKYDLYPHISFDTKIVSAEWSNEANEYTIVAIDTRTSKVPRDLINEESDGDKKTFKAQILISAHGILEIPHLPEVPGIVDFKGTIFHSARWDDGVELKGKRVCVIGNGSSSAQFVPIITEDPAVQVTQFIRTPSWYRIDPWKHYSPMWQNFFKWFPVFLQLKRFAIWCELELNWFLLRSQLLNRLLVQTLFSWHMRSTAPKEYRTQMKPSYPAGCKRVIYDRDGRYLRCLNRPNMSLNFDGIEKFVPEGILTKKGEVVSADVVITATGYSTNTFPIPLKGVSGQTVEEYYDAHDGPQAYHGTTVPGFPNLCLISGPNTVTGHNSVIYSTEIQVSYIMKLISPIIKGHITSFNVRDAATESYNKTVQRWLSDSIYNQCVSWYRVKRPKKDDTSVSGGEGEAGKAAMMFPGPLMVMKWWMRKVVWGDYEVNGPGAAEWKRKRTWAGRLRGSLAFLGVLGVLFAGIRQVRT